jgi:putative spermidine/putrescine transport system ATP-binding protein
MEDPAMAFLELKGLVKRYGDFTAVEDCSLSVEQGEFLCLLGPSGCGKTTTLQMVAGFTQPSVGRIVLDGKDITDLKPNKRGLGVVFQSYALFPHMTVYDNVAFGLHMRKVPTRDLTRKVSETLDLVHLGAFAQRYPSELSGGQKQRVAMARALVIQPPVLLLDEPMGALDAKLREEMQIELRALQRRVGITTIMVTHDQAEAMTLADRVVLMNKGRIQQIARPVEMYEEPNGRFSSTFLGKANVFEGQRVAGGIAVGGRILPCTLGACEGEVDYIIRPEKISFVQIDSIVRGHVAARLFLGHHWLFQIQTDLGLIQVTQANTELPTVIEGDEVGLSWRAEHARVIGRALV